MNEMITWLRAQLDTDEQNINETLAEVPTAALYRRLLRQVQAHRAILDVVARWRHTTCDDSWYSCSQATSDNGYDEYLACANDDRHGEPCDCGLEVRQRKILGPLVSIYSDRDGYNPEWSA